MPDQSYSDRIRHPSGALNPSRDEGWSREWWFWILLGLAAAFGYFAWRKGWLDPIIAAAKAVVKAARPIANPHRWV